MDWRAVGAGTSFAAAHVWALALPVLEGAYLSSVLLVPAVGVSGGALAGFLSESRAAGERHGLLAGSLAGLLFAGAFWVALDTPGLTRGAFRSLNYLLAVSAGRFPVVARHGPAVVAALGVVGATVIALAGRWAGGVAAAKEGELAMLGR